MFAKYHSIEKRKRNFLQNLEFREENENFVFKILTIENILRNQHSILQLEIEKNGPFPLEFFSRSRISSLPVKEGDGRKEGKGANWRKRSGVNTKRFLVKS